MSLNRIRCKREIGRECNHTSWSLEEHGSYRCMMGWNSRGGAASWRSSEPQNSDKKRRIYLDAEGSTTWPTSKPGVLASASGYATRKTKSQQKAKEESRAVELIVVASASGYATRKTKSQQKAKEESRAVELIVVDSRQEAEEKWAAPPLEPVDATRKAMTLTGTNPRTSYGLTTKFLGWQEYLGRKGNEGEMWAGLITNTALATAAEQTTTEEAGGSGCKPSLA
ncbi:hypothetical protein GALMADRAFT_205268 [Galerina marginata CBS 339.88]|uniref:Uncharacterized protein n=1 Tax=Galerina marginata (strain CBS 339.88) TaxID=685588 RepID=A0A067U1A5_GALM3|nr:hypothetical protein GALMADRAFT_205268 [Galerina marginata CBS 339.88]